MGRHPADPACVLYGYDEARRTSLNQAEYQATRKGFILGLVLDDVAG
jgi:hypothetical protein